MGCPERPFTVLQHIVWEWAEPAGVFPLDGSSWPQPRAQVLEDRQYV